MLHGLLNTATVLAVAAPQCLTCDHLKLFSSQPRCWYVISPSAVSPIKHNYNDDDDGLLLILQRKHSMSSVFRRFYSMCMFGCPADNNQLKWNRITFPRSVIMAFLFHLPVIADNYDHKCLYASYYWITQTNHTVRVHLCERLWLWLWSTLQERWGGIILFYWRKSMSLNGMTYDFRYISTAATDSLIRNGIGD